MNIDIPHRELIEWEGIAFGYGYDDGEYHIMPAVKRFFAICPENGMYDYRLLEQSLTPVVAWLLINRFCQLDLLEYGSSPRTAWLTERGRALKAELDGMSVDAITDVDYATRSLLCEPGYCSCIGIKCTNRFLAERSERYEQ